MLVREVIEKLKLLPQNADIKICDTKKFKSDFKIENGKFVLPLGITGYEIIKEIKNITDENNTFLNDVTMVCDMLKMTRAEFLNKYFYLTGLQYDLSKDLFYSDKKKYIQQLYDRMVEVDSKHLEKQTQILEQEILNMQNVKKCKLF